MSHTTRIALVSALLLAPMAARAQQPPHAAPHPASPGAPTTAPGVAPAAEPFPGDAVGDEGMWFDDGQLAFGLGDEFYLDSGDLDGGDGDAPVAMDETPGPDGGRHVMVRRFQTGPGGMGMGMRRGDMNGRPMFNRRAPMLMRLKLAQLDLSDAQRTRLRDLHEAHARKAIQRRADMQLARMDLRKLMRADRPDAGAVNAQIDRLARMHAEALKAAFEMRMQARAVLTPEQLKQLQEPMDGMRMHHDMMDTPDGRPKR
jgi:Spy/CpxP family protein refolding chaperone